MTLIENSSLDCLGRALQARVRLWRLQQSLHEGQLLVARQPDRLVLGDHPARCVLCAGDDELAQRANRQRRPDQCVREIKRLECLCAYAAATRLSAFAWRAGSRAGAARRQRTLDSMLRADAWRSGWRLLTGQPPSPSGGEDNRSSDRPTVPLPVPSASA